MSGWVLDSEITEFTETQRINEDRELWDVSEKEIGGSQVWSAFFVPQGIHFIFDSEDEAINFRETMLKFNPWIIVEEDVEDEEVVIEEE